ncbi:MAG: translation initiation factor IF-2 [Desulfuromonadia bacterium]
MTRIRVYELAQKLGLDNKEVIRRLREIGVVVTTHAAAIDEKDAQKLTALIKGSATESSAPPTAPATEEVRVKSTLIRRRAKPSPTAADEPSAPPSVPETPQVPPPAPQTEPLPTPRSPESHPVEAVEVTTPTSAPEPVTTEKERGDESPDAAPPTTVEPPSPNRARILGRVELPLPASSEPLDTRRTFTPTRETGRPAPGSRSPSPRPQGDRQQPRRPSGAPEPVSTVASAPPSPDRKGKLRDIPVIDDRPAPPPGGKKPSVAAKKKEALRKTELLEKRERIFEPGPKFSKGKKKEKDKSPESKKTEITVPKASKRIIRISDTITVGELAKRMGVKANDLIRLLMKMGMMVTINHPLDFETAAILSADFGYEVENVAVDLDEILESTPDLPESLEKRPPVVTIMGHVDHGKTSLLDAIRETNVIAGEAGGITQHIGAYDVELNGRKITFLDTPGHEAFTAMRARGAKVTDIVILVVAADDGVMPQTREAINHSRAAGVPIIVAINKIDKPDARPERVKQELTEHGLVASEWGGDTTMVEVSAKQRLNLEELLEMVLLQADLMDLKANPNKPAKGTIVEAKLDKGRGPVATVLVQEGTLKTGDYCVVGVHSGRIRAMQNDRGEKVTSAGPSMPVEVIGLSGVPDAGDIFVAMQDERQAREIVTLRQIKQREAELAKHSKLSLDDLYRKIQSGEVKDLNVIVKGDVQGSIEAVSESLKKLSTAAVRLNVIHSAVGAITETDVNLASASNAIIIGFNVRPEVKAQQLAEREGVDVRLYNIIYDALEDVKKAMEGLLEPTLREKYLGRAEIREIFSVPKVGNVAGCYVLDGKIVRNAQVRLLRDNVVVYEGKLASLRRFKDDVREVATGYECGMGLENYNDIKVGDVIEAFEMEKVAATL